MARQTPVRDPAVLKARLDALVETFDLSTISPDPLELVRRQTEPLDQEVVALLAAAFAYGRADIVIRNVGGVIGKMEPSPFAYLRDRFTERDAARRFAGFRHRFHGEAHLIALVRRMARAIRSHGSIGELFARHYDPSEPDLAGSLGRFVAAMISIAPGEERTDAGLRYLLSSPADGSACKRMNLFLRWMVRRHEPDLGLWTFVDPAKLIMPLDTHVQRITTFLGLNRRRSADWKTARELTDRLARFAPDDPVRYDFAICRLGILNLCSRRRKRELCEACLLNDVCRLSLAGSPSRGK